MVLILSFFTYIMLDLFVIPKAIKKATKTSTIALANTNDKGTVTSTDTTYEDNNIKITITTLRKYNTNVYVADVQIKNSEYLKTAFANNTFGYNITSTTSSTASSNNAILAINGDYYGSRTSGYVIKNGIIYRSQSNGNTDLAIYKDGTLRIIDENSSTAQELVNNGVTDILSFGPTLLSSSNITVTTTQEVAKAKSSNPRTAIGMISSLHYVFVVSDGRTSESTGLSLYELASVMKELGCTTAYNLDGGGSSTMYFNGKIVNNPTDGNTSGERKVSDIVYVGY